MIISEQIAQGMKIYFMVMNFVYSIKCQFHIELDFEFCNETGCQNNSQIIHISTEQNKYSMF